jgi:hypothetical protein
MYRLLAFAVCLVVAAAMPGCSQMKSMAGESSGLTSLLTKQLGVTDTQASGEQAKNLLAGALK